MSSPAASFTPLSIVPLGAGDLIDRAVRFYRRHFAIFVMISAVPVVIGTLLSVGWLYVARSLFLTTGSYDAVESDAYAIVAGLGAIVIWFVESVATLAVMGGASRNFVRHLLFGEAISFRATYRYTWQRFAALVVASVAIIFLMIFFGLMIFYGGIIVAVLLSAVAMLAFQSAPVVGGLITAVVIIAALVGIYWLFCLVASRFAYVPQAMLVEDTGILGAFGRSFSLASGNVKRFAALFGFTIVATYSALAVLYIPLMWYAWGTGVDLSPLGATITPAWYEIASQLIWQAGIIVLSPVWMIGLCLLYVDERVRHEGYDIELMAAARLGEMPSVPGSYINPLQPALGSREAPALPSTSSGSSISTLGLK